MPVRTGGGGIESLKKLLEYLQVGMPEHGPRPPGVAVGSAIGQAAGGVADIGGDLFKGFKDIMAGVQEGYGGVEAPKPPVLTAPTERSVFPGPKVSDQPPRKVVDPLTQPVTGPGFAQGVPPTPQPSFNLGSPGQFQGIGAADMDTMPSIQQPGMGARSLNALKEIFGPGGSVDWEFNVPDTGITFAPGQTRRQGARALAKREAEADIAGTQAGTLRDLSQAGVYELEADPDFQRFKLMQPALAAALLEEGRNKRFDIGRQVSEKDVYLGQGMDRRAGAQIQGRAENVMTQGTFAGINKQLPSGGDVLRNAMAIRQQYDKIALEQGPDAAEQFRVSMVTANPRLAPYLPAQPAPEPSSWLPWR